jgi:tRNA(Ile)-lysidine synthetase-like protein
MLSFSHTFSSVVHPKDILVIGVSGGVDSMVLLDLVRKFHPSENIVVAHFDHSLRWAESDGDRDFVADFCKRENIVFQTKKVDILAFAKERKGSIEAVARKERYDFLEHVRAEQWARYILTAHHADDQVETMLLNLIKGGKSQWLSGMSTVSTSSFAKGLLNWKWGWGLASFPLDKGGRGDLVSVQNPQSSQARTASRNEYGTGSLQKELIGTIFRPLLEQTKEEILHYAKNCNIQFREDASNSDTRYERNRIRQDIIPVFREINPSIHRTFQHLASYMQEVTEYFDHASLEWLEDAEWKSGKKNTFLIRDFHSTHPFLQRELIAHLYREAHSGSSQGLSAKLINELIRFISDPNSFGVKDIGKLHLERRGERVVY